jgi:antitoxin component of RelBE/YafQ-DinJ toxin-antitoxin module
MVTWLIQHIDAGIASVSRRPPPPEEIVEFWRILRRNAGLPIGRYCHTIIAMAADSFIQCRVSAETKEALHAAAERQQLSESALVKRMIDLMLHTAAPPAVTAVPSDNQPTRLARLVTP